jgi:hypothetical protein
MRKSSLYQNSVSTILAYLTIRIIHTIYIDNNSLNNHSEVFNVKDIAVLSLQSPAVGRKVNNIVEGELDGGEKHVLETS